MNNEFIKIINENIDFRKCIEKCTKENSEKTIIYNAYRIKDKIYNDTDDIKYNKVKSNCYINCLRK